MINCNCPDSRAARVARNRQCPWSSHAKRYPPITYRNDKRFKSGRKIINGLYEYRFGTLLQCRVDGGRGIRAMGRGERRAEKIWAWTNYNRRYSTIDPVIRQS